MVGMNEFYHHLTQFHFFTGHYCMSCSGIQHFVFSQFIFQKTQSQQCTKHRYIQLFQDVRQCTDMVFVTMGQHDTSDFFDIFCQIGHIRDHQVDTQHIILRESQTAVDDDDIIAIFQHSHIFTDLFQTTQCNYFQVHLWFLFGFISGT